MLTRSPPVPKRITRRCSSESAFQGLLRSIPRSRATARTMSLPQVVASPTAPSGFTAPSFTESSGFGTTRSGSISMRVPRPEHSGHIPWGELKENSCGVGSGKEIPQWWQARCSERTWSGFPSAATITVPWPSLSAVSTESVRRWESPGFATRRSTTASIECFFFLSRRISSSRESTMPSTRTRVNPDFPTCSTTSRCSPFLSFTSGARTRNFVPSGSCRTSWTICCADCCETGRPQRWQVSRPTRAHSTRR